MTDRFKVSNLLARQLGEHQVSLLALLQRRKPKPLFSKPTARPHRRARRVSTLRTDRYGFPPERCRMFFRWFGENYPDR